MRAKKHGEFVHVKVEQSLADQLKAYASETGYTKTAVVEKALKAYFEKVGITVLRPE